MLELFLLFFVISICTVAVSASSDRILTNFRISSGFTHAFTRIQEELERLNAGTATYSFSNLSMKYLHDEFWEGEKQRRKEKELIVQMSGESNQSLVRSSEFVCECMKQDDDMFVDPAEAYVILDKKNATFSMSSILSCTKIDKKEEDPAEDDGMTLHFCFLVHGFKGMASDLSYIESSMTNFYESQKSSVPGKHDLIVHSVLCNERRTNDGIEQGGERVVQEIMDVIYSKINNYCEVCMNIKDITVSFLGNSLGGLYSRYAMAKICEILTPESGFETSDDVMRLQNGKPVHFNVFYTTAAPHLGVANHTYVPLPRGAEIGIGYAMGPTGEDLFRINDLVWNMATTEKFLRPLSSFRTRVAYANAYRTDFPVPTKTAAFLHSSSRHPHRMTEDIEPNSQNDLIIGSFITEKRDDSPEIPGSNTKLSSSDDRKRRNVEDDLKIMSSSLDSLGWKKVFVDMRREIPIGVNLSLGRKKGINSQVMDPLKSLREKEVIESRDLVSTLESPEDKRFNFPIGHNMICAHSRNRLHTLVNRGGRPVMDKLAKEMLDDILSWRDQEHAEVEER